MALGFMPRWGLVRGRVLVLATVAASAAMASSALLAVTLGQASDSVTDAEATRRWNLLSPGRAPAT